MRYDHGPHGIFGITMKLSALKKWAYSMYMCSDTDNLASGSYSSMQCKPNLLEGDKNVLLQYELAPVSVSMFADNGEMRIAETNATIKKNLQVETPPRLTPQVDVTIIDGCTILCVIHWPNRGTVRYFVDSFTCFIFGKAERCDIYLISDRYHDFKSDYLEMANRRLKLRLQTPLPPRRLFLM